MLKAWYYKVVCYIWAAGLWPLPAGAADIKFQTELFSSIGGIGAVEKAMFKEVNAEREKAGLAPFVWDRHLAAAARQHSAEMERLFYFSHDSPTPGLKDASDRVYAAGLTDAIIGENLAVENNVPPSAAPEDVGKEFTAVLLASAEHRDNILDRRFSYSGIGCAASDEGTIFCTQLFSKKLIDFNRLRIKEKVKDTLIITLSLKTDDEVGVWFNDRDVRVFRSDGGVISIDALFPVDDGPVHIVMARRAVGEVGKMTGFFVGTLDPQKPFDLATGITEVDVICEEQKRMAVKFFSFEAYGKTLNGATELTLADGDFRRRVDVNGYKFKTRYDIPAAPGIHEIYFVVDDEAAHRVIVDAGAPLATAFAQGGEGGF